MLRLDIYRQCRICIIRWSVSQVRAKWPGIWPIRHLVTKVFLLLDCEVFQCFSSEACEVVALADVGGIITKTNIRRCILAATVC